MDHKYRIYQLGDNVARSLRFAPYTGQQVNVLDYDCVYEGVVARDNDESENEVLERLYVLFNVNHPADFTGHSMSVSDVVGLQTGNRMNYYYVDSFGFIQIKDFMKRPRRERTIWVENIKQILAFAIYGIALNNTFNKGDHALYEIFREKFIKSDTAPIQYSLKAVKDPVLRMFLQKRSIKWAAGLFLSTADISRKELDEVIRLAEKGETPSGRISDTGVAVWEMLKYAHCHDGMEFYNWRINDCIAEGILSDLRKAG